MRKDVAKIIEEIKPALQADGGDIELVKVARGIVYVRLKGACAGCPMAQVTLQLGVENQLKEKIKGIKRVVAVV